jgi:hypothetical protein
LLLAAPAATQAGDYAYDLPQLVGHHLGDMPAAPVYELAVDLGLPFAEINGATLRLEGVHTPGVYGYLSQPHTFEAAAEAIAWIPDQPFLSAYADDNLPLPGGPFDLSLPWRGKSPQPTAPDLSAWLDGTAELNFQLAPPILVAITYQIHQPAITINAATLIIHGQPALDMFMLPGDLNGDRAVNDADLAAWQASPQPNGSDFLTWQRHHGAATPTPTAAVPEPQTLSTLTLAALTLAPHRRRRSPPPAA